MTYQEARRILDQQEAAKATVEQYEKFAKAHEAYGFKSRREFIQALEELDGRGRARSRGARSAGRAGGRGLSEDIISQIKTMKADGKSNAEISRTVGASPITVAKYVNGTSSAKAAGGKTRAAKGARKASAKGGRGLTSEVVKQLKSLKAEGKSNAEISRVTGVSPLTVAKYAGGAKKGKARRKVKSASGS